MKLANVGKTVKCINPTSTLTKGKLYKVLRNFYDEYFVENDNGRKIKVLADRFELA